MMDLSKKVTTLVEEKLGKVIDRDLKRRVKKGDVFFDVSSYVDELFYRYFPEEEANNVKSEIVIANKSIKSNIRSTFSEIERKLESEDSTESDAYSQGSLELETHDDFRSYSMDEIITNLQSDSNDIRAKCLRELELFAEDLINQKSWNVVKKILQNFLEAKTDRKIQILTMKVFQKFLFCSTKPQMVCEAFVCLTEVLIVRLEIVNLIRTRPSLDEIYSIKECKWIKSDNLLHNNNEFHENTELEDSEILLKSMFLLIQCQKQMPGKWIRFSGKRLRDIIFAFVHLLASTSGYECEKLSGLELLSILNPSGNWCRHWCHTATGRSLLCSAMKKNKTFLIRMLEIILASMKQKKFHNLLPVINNTYIRDPSPKNGFLFVNDVHEYTMDKENRKICDEEGCHSAPTGKFDGKPTKKLRNLLPSKYLLENVPRKVAKQAMFCHSFSVIVSLIRFRSGRSLFPVQTQTTRRFLSVQDLASFMTTYMHNFERDHVAIKGTTVTHTYRQHMSEVMDSLRNVQLSLYTSRGSASKISQHSHR